MCLGHPSHWLKSEKDKWSFSKRSTTLVSGVRCLWFQLVFAQEASHTSLVRRFQLCLRVKCVASVVVVLMWFFQMAAEQIYSDVQTGDVRPPSARLSNQRVSPLSNSQNKAHRLCSKNLTEVLTSTPPDSTPSYLPNSLKCIKIHSSFYLQLFW